MLSIITNPLIVSVLVMVILCLLKFNVFLSMIVASLLCGVLSGAGVVETLTTFYTNMGNDNRMVLFLLLLGVLAATMKYNGLGEALAPRVAKLIGKKVWLFPVVLLVLAVISETFVLVGVSFLLILVPPLFQLLVDYKVDRRLLVIATCCGLQLGYGCVPVGYGLGFMGIIQSNLQQNGLEVSIDQIWKANLVMAIALVIAFILAMIKFGKPRTYAESAAAKEAAAKAGELPPITFKHYACLIAAISVIVIQLTTGSMPLAGLVMVFVLLLTGAIKLKDFEKVFMNGIMGSVYVCLVLMASVGFAAIGKTYGNVNGLVEAASALVGGSKFFGAFFMLLLGLFVTMGIGSSFSTIPVVATILVPLGLNLNMSPAAIIMLVAAAAALGDSGSPASNQTLIPTAAFNIDGQHDHISDSCLPSFLFVNIPIIVVCTIAACVM